MMNDEFKILILFVFTCLLVGCGSSSQNDSYAPKPKGYNRIAMPPQTYQPIGGEYPYQFDISTAAVVLPDSSPLAEKDWIYLYYPKLDANIQLTYKPVRRDQPGCATSSTTLTNWPGSTKSAPPPCSSRRS